MVSKLDGLLPKVALNESACRIVSTVPSNTEILYSLGLKDQVVGITKYCAKTCDTRGKVVIGDIYPNIFQRHK